MAAVVQGMECVVISLRQPFRSTETLSTVNPLSTAPKCFITLGLGLTMKTIPHTSSSKGSLTLLPIYAVPCRSPYFLPESRSLRRLVQAILLAYRTNQPIGRPSRMHFLVLRHRRSRLNMGSLHVLLATALRRPFLPWSWDWSQIRHRPHLHRRMFSRPHSWCLGHAVADVDCIWDRAWRYHFRRVWWDRRQCCVETDARKYRCCSRHSLRYDLLCPRVPTLGKPTRQLQYSPFHFFSST